MKKKYGKIYINFHEPFSLQDLLIKNNSTIHEMTSKEQNILCRELGHRIISAIEEVSVATPYSLAASAILNNSYHKFTYDQININLTILLNHLITHKFELADTLRKDPERVLKHILEHFVQRKFIEKIVIYREKSSPGILYKINENKRSNLEYYKNNVVSFFIPAAYSALIILNMETEQFTAKDLYDDYIILVNMFINEFTSNIDHTYEYLVRKTIKGFINNSVIVPHPTLPDTYHTTAAGNRKLKFFSSFLKAYFESYLITLNFFERYKRNSMKPEDRLNKIQSLGAEMFRQNQIECMEALSSINYQNAVDFYTRNGIRGSDDKKKITDYKNTIQKYLNIFKSK